MFGTKVVWYGRTHTVLLSVWSYDYVETFCRDDIKIFEWIALPLIIYSCIWHSGFFKSLEKKGHYKLLSFESIRYQVINFQIRRGDTRNYLISKLTACNWLTVLGIVFWQCHISDRTMVELYLLYYIIIMLYQW
jgi:hypothetical protein